MTYPAFTAFKLRAITAATSSTGASVTQATVPFRAKYLYSVYTQNCLVVPNATGASTAINLAVSGSTATVDAFLTNPIFVSTSTSTTVAGVVIGASPSPAMFLNQGDCLTTIGTTAMPYSVTHILQEL